MTSTGRRYDTPKRIVMSNKNYIGPKAEAIRYAITVFRRIFALAVQHRHIAATEMPTFITKKLKLQRRGAFTRNELADLFWHLHGLRANDADRLLASYARLLLWTGIRPGVEASLRFEDILAVPERRDRKGRVVKQAVVHVFVRDGKTGPRTVVAPLKLLRVIDALKAHHPNPVPNALIWTKPNGIEVVSFMARFAGILETLSLTTDLDGRQRSLYSMRHTHITRCIERQVPISWIAKNCGNSIMIIERNYDHVKHTEQSDVVYK
jgi:integrase